MKTSNYLQILLFFIASPVFAQWVSINPGAGGQVQDVVCDPSNVGTLYIPSDMEGVYKSTNNGENWHMTGKLVNNRVYSVAINPENSEHIYVGTLNGLQSSTNGGDNYKFVTSSLGKSFGEIKVNPNNPKQIIAGVGWRDDYDFAHFFDDTIDGYIEILISNNGGDSWERRKVNPNQVPDKNIWTISFHPNQKETCVVGASDGIYISKDNAQTFTKIDGPEEAKLCRGVGLSPDGEVLYATYAYEGKKSYPFAKTWNQSQWIKIDKGSGVDLPFINWWYPEIDPRSTKNEHKLILPVEGSRDGLFEGTFYWENDSLVSYAYECIWEGTKGYDFGWDMADPNPRFAHYTPIKWQRAIWSTTNENFFEGVYSNDGKYLWRNKYSNPHLEHIVDFHGEKYPTYSSKGTESTYTYDILVHKNYVLQAQGDNGMLESWDGGKSWSNLQHRQDTTLNLSDVQSCVLAKIDGKDAVVIQATGGYGGRAVDGKLYYKILEHCSPKDKWIFLGGGPNHALGLPDGVFREINVDPNHPERLYVFSTNYGLYRINNLTDAVKDPNYKVEKISNGVADKALTSKCIQVDPNDENVVYFTGTSGLTGVFKGVLDNGNWKWKRIYKGGSWESEIVAWDRGGKTYLVYEGEPCKGGCDYVVALSKDDGETWENIFTKPQAMDLRGNKNDEWYPHIKEDYVFQSKGGIAATENMIIANYYNHKHQNGWGVFMGIIQDDDSVIWTDITDNLHYIGLTSSRIVQREEDYYFYISTPGAGAWFRKLPINKDIKVN
ncbi:hypothetical protein KMW28_20900 [Flammeovirga yaeyamensis]|uniref:Glycosyl hydrolase n=1 Tax=Flammeovirga yaeyamensis TaxID=367791 RepID=A0AAX1NBP9_9BACT|nr:hypothetical protein [Flammeovirga yaeyamensis]MBB3697193.1 photosystem II stability/assembly factor-like uncharacterized protein [Flammeovirga yaeyamensis]NMF33853.1 hypothetical protein [Flammeovirga yaeyamensis]QWG04885.1 hypothetical protein KMW28_20900 [Flammeovirga yaeyamensis]